ncbi:cell surface glycoprotein CD200 receptor 1-A isoform X2 [Centroberyx gerrardi]
MREMMWVFGVIILLMVSEAWSLDSVFRDENVSLGSDVKLTCVNKTWSEMIYTLWKIKLKSKDCNIGSSNSGKNHNLCNNDMALHNTSSGESYLLIPKVSSSEEGVYNCESVYTGGRYSVTFNVSVTVHPEISSWLEWNGNRRVAVCLAARGKPAASVEWRNVGNSSSVPTEKIRRDPDGSYTVESRLDLPEGLDPGNLTCAVRYAYWRKERTMIPGLKPAAPVPWVPLLISVIIIIVILPGLLYFARKKLIIIRNCRRSDTLPSESKSPPAEDVEEVEPYASYIQRVNSIYNSSADLFI